MFCLGTKDRSTAMVSLASSVASKPPLEAWGIIRSRGSLIFGGCGIRGVESKECWDFRVSDLGWRVGSLELRLRGSIQHLWVGPMESGVSSTSQHRDCPASEVSPPLNVCVTLRFFTAIIVAISIMIISWSGRRTVTSWPGPSCSNRASTRTGEQSQHSGCPKPIDTSALRATGFSQVRFGLKRCATTLLKLLELL